MNFNTVALGEILVEERGAFRTEEEPQSRFRILSIKDLYSLQEPSWLVHSVLPDRGTVEMHGMPATAKSFIALDMALHIATGKDWHGNITKKGAVLYVAAEGADGYRQRIQTWRDAHTIDEVDSLYFVASSVQLHERSVVEEFLKIVEATGVRFSLIIFDTLARCFVGGEENSSTAMGVFLDGAATVAKALDSTILLVHHTRKDGSTERGSIALRGNVDAMMAVERNKTNKTITLKSVKMKNGPEFKDIHFRLAPLGESCVIERGDAPPSTSSKKEKEADVDARIFECLSEVGLTHGDWLAEVEARDITSESSFNRARRRLVEEGKVSYSRKLYRPIM